VVTPEGLPLADEVLPGNTADKTTLRGFLERIERQYGKARRVWLMDRGGPTEEVLGSIATNCGKHDCAKAGIGGAPISSRKTPPSCEAIIYCWWRSRRRSRTSRACPREGGGRSGNPTSVSPARGAHRGARLHGLLGLLLARHAGAAPAGAAPGLTPRLG
jgi:hypothetical protein